MLALKLTSAAGVLVDEMMELAESLASQGSVPSALNLLLQQVLPPLDANGAFAEAALAASRVADILERDGRHQAALDLWTGQILPRTEEDPRLQIEALQRIADLFGTMENYDESIRVRCEAILPIAQDIEDEETYTLNLAYVAETLFRAGRLEESLNAWTENVIPAFMQLGDDGGCAYACGKIADIYQARGDHHEALRIRLHEQIPTYEELGDLESLVVARTNLAINLIARDAEGDADNARIILEAALSDAEAEELPAAKEIGAYMAKIGLLPS